MNFFKVSCLLLIAVLLSACAGQVNPQARSFYDNISQKKEPVSLLLDSCILRNEVGTSHVKVFSSKDVSDKIASVVSDFFTKQGVSIQSVKKPLVCGGYGQDLLKSYSIKMTDDSDREPMAYPIIIEKQNTPEAISAYMKIYTLMTASSESKSTDKDFLEAGSKIDLSDADAQTLKLALLTDKVWVITASGSQVSFARAFGTGLATAAVSVATFGLASGVYSYTMPQKAISFQVALVDLSKKEVLWKKNVFEQRDPAKIDAYTESWVNDFFYPFYEKSKLVK
jgi:hypothetical protein